LARQNLATLRKAILDADPKSSRSGSGWQPVCRATHIAVATPQGQGKLTFPMAACRTRQGVQQRLWARWAAIDVSEARIDADALKELVAPHRL